MASISKTRTRKRTLSPAEEASAKKSQPLSNAGSKDRNLLQVELQVSLERCDSTRSSTRLNRSCMFSPRDKRDPKNEAIPTSSKTQRTPLKDSKQQEKDMYSVIKQRIRTPPQKPSVPSESETDNEPEKSPLPKKRGRPRKSVEDIATVKTDSGAGNSQSPGKRGRPRKSVEDIATVETDSGAVNSQSPGKRGRPRKSIEETVKTIAITRTSPQKQLVPSQTEAVCGPDITPFANKRFRPRKLVDELATVTHPTPQKQSVAGESECDNRAIKVVSPKKRGRPRKSVEETDNHPVTVPSLKKRGRPRKPIKADTTFALLNDTVNALKQRKSPVKQKKSEEISQKQNKKEESVICIISSDELTSESEVFPASTQSSQQSGESSSLPSQGEDEALGSENTTGGILGTDSQDASQEVASVEEERSLATNQRKGLIAVPEENTFLSPEEQLISPLPKLSSSKSRKLKSKRRSSFAVGRKSKGVINLPSSELCKTIPKDLPEEERFARLQQLLVRRTLEKMEAEAGDKVGFSQFKLEALEKTEKLTQQMREDGTFKQACTPSDRLLPNPVNIQNENLVEIYNAATVRLNTECDSWNALLQKREDLVREAKMMYMYEKQEDSAIAMERPSTLSQAEKKVLDSRPNYKKILSDSVLNYEFADVFVDKIQKTVSMMTRDHKQAKECIRKQSEYIRAQVLKDVPDPLDTISALTCIDK